MKFYKAVQQGSVIGPLRREFKVQAWNDAFQNLQEDGEDLNLCIAGLLIYSKANEIRSGLKMTFAKDLNATTKLRSFVAIANYNFCMLQNKTRDAFKQATAGLDTVMPHELAAIKHKLLSGAEFSGVEIAESIVDGSQVPIKVILQVKPQLGGNAQFGNINWDHVIWDSNMGILYSHIEDLWDDCLWNDYLIHQNSEGNTFSPNDSTWQFRLTASRFRHNNLAMQFFGIARAMMANMDSNKLHSQFMVRDVRAVSKHGRKQLIKLAPASAPTEDGVGLLAARLYATEPYYMELIHESRQELGGATLNDLLSAWTVISRTAEILRDEVMSVEFSDSSQPNSWLSRFVPVLQVDALSRAIADAMDIQLGQARTIVEFFTYRGAGGQDLWAQPLVPISIEGISPMFAATSSPNLGRLVDIWMRQIGIDLGLRGPAFEKYVNFELRKYIDSSSLLKNAKVTEDGLLFKPTDAREEQIDTVLVIGDLVILGESKCTLHPVEAKQIAMHRNTVTDAVLQIKRKVQSVESYPKIFREQLSQKGVEIPEKFRVLPVVILNGSIHAGFEVDGVAIVDMYIFEVFFSGELVDLAIQNTAGNIEHVKKRILYSDIHDASRIASAYFRSPPQMEVLLKGMSNRWVPIGQVSDSDWAGAYLTFECIPQVEHDNVASVN